MDSLEQIGDTKKMEARYKFILLKANSEIDEYQEESEQSIHRQKKLQEETDFASKGLVTVIEQKHILERNKIYEVIRHKVQISISSKNIMELKYQLND